MQSARWGDLEGRNWAGLVRLSFVLSFELSFEIDEGPATTGNNATGTTDAKPALPVIGQWAPAISVEEWEAVTELLGSNPEPGRGHNTRKYLLRGTLRCERDGCGAALRIVKASASCGGGDRPASPTS